MLFKRYAQPMTILDKMIQCRRLSEFVTEFIKIQNDETEDKTLWEYWIHKVFDKTFQEFIDYAKQEKHRNEEISMNQDKLEATVKESKGIINGFCPF